MMSNSRDAADPRGLHGHRAGATSQRRREAFAALVPPAVERLLPVAFQILGDTDLAEEATHIAVINAWRKLPSLREPAQFEAWLYRLVVNACRDEVRRRPWEVHSSVPFDLAVDATEREQQVDDRDRLDRAFRRLSVDHRAVIVLHHHVGLPLVEVGRTLGKSHRNDPFAPPLRDACDAQIVGARRRVAKGTGDRMNSDQDLDIRVGQWLDAREAPASAERVFPRKDTSPPSRRRGRSDA